MKESLSSIDDQTNKNNNTVCSEDHRNNFSTCNDTNQLFLSPKQIGYVFSRNTRYFIFVLLIFINLIINMDHGTIPAATSEIKQDLNIDNDNLGVLGSLVYLGNLLG